MFRRIIVVLLILGCLVCATPVGSAEPDKVMVMLDWVPNTNHTGLYVALDKGWYEEQGLEVEIVQPAESGSPEKVVGAGQADFAISHQEDVSHARAEDVPIVSIAAIIQHNTSGFASPQEKDITRPKDFEGKKYGAWGSPIEQAVLEVLMACDDADVDEVEFVNIGWADYFVVTKRDVDFAWIFYGWTGIEAELRDEPLNIVMLSDWADCVPDYYTPVIVTSEGAIEEKPDVIRRFMAATSQGYEFTIENPEEAADILLSYTPESNAELVKASQEWLSDQYQADAPCWGQQKLEIWQGYADWMADREVLPQYIEAEKAFTNEFLPECPSEAEP
jgi:ABC-type nitrate/sulfonate/bicarbonate transport system substrate-binding protein